MTIINSIYKGKRYAILLTTILTFYAPVLFAQHIADSALVEVAYGQQPEWRRTSAISSIRGEDLLKTTSASLGNSLQGQLPGLTLLQQSGEPGYDFSIANLYLRGRTSYASGQKMLVYVDGFEAPIESLSTAEIESVTLLKDASALALYGMRGANGVLLVTTKKGCVSAPQVSIRLQTGIQQPLGVPDPVNAYDYATLYNQARVNDGLPRLYTPEELNAYQNNTDPYFYPNVNWKKAILNNTAPLSMADLSFKGGGDVVQYYVMMNLLQNIGFYKDTDKKRRENSNAYYASFNFRSNLNIQISKHLSTGLNFSGSVGNRSIPGGSSSANGLLGAIWRTAPNAFPVYNPDGSYGGNAAFTNPVGNIVSRGLYKENSRTFQLIFMPKYDLEKLTKGLSVSAGIAYNNYMADSSIKNQNYARYSLSKGAGGEVLYTPYGVDSPLESDEGFRTDWSRLNFKAQLDYDRVFKQHQLTASIFFLSDLYQKYGSRDDIKYLNYAGRVTYSYNQKYIGEFAASYTGCDDYAPGKRYGFFPAFSAGWILSKENFMKNINWVEYLKLRASIGLVGNNQNENGRYLFDQTYSSNGSYFLGTGSSSTGGFRADMIANPDISWEKERVFNIGLDAVLLKGLSVEFDYFHKERYDILSQPYSTIPGFVGASYGDILPYMNVGKVKNQGFEGTIRYESSLKNNFNYYVETSAWYAKNEIVDMAEEVKLYDYQYRKGRSVNTPFVLVADGLYQESDFDSNGSLKSHLPVPQFGEVNPGDIKYIDKNGDGVVDSNDSYPVGYSNIPEWNYALKIGFEWKGIDVEALFHGVANRDIYLSGPLAYSFTDNGSASKLALDSWTPENPNASYPRLSTRTFENNYRISTYWKRNGNYFRMKNIRIGYTFPQSIARAIKLSRLYVYANASNLFTVSHLDGLADPESSSLITYPLTRSYNLGIKIDF